MTTAILVVESVVLVLLTLLVAGLLRSHAEILRRLHALGAGLDPDADSTPISLNRSVDLRASDPDSFAAAVDVVGAGLRDDAVHVSIVGTRHRTLLAFLSSGCLTCQGFWDAFADAPGLDLPDDIRLVVVTKNGDEESMSALRGLAPSGVPVVMSSAAWTDYRVPGSPYFVLIDGSEGRVRGEGTGAHWDQVKNLLRQAADDATDDTREVRIDRELLAHGIEPGDPSLYRTAEQISGQSRA
ncbi:MAG TPA: hypothetical protein VGP92_19825 [Acidimicrobiia bacterium]|nr:hypothetical protein [Acidimicrobiia bacterium]